VASNYVALIKISANIILNDMATIITVLQIILSVLLITGIVMQTSAAGLGGAFGGSDSVDAGYHTRRGFDKVLFNGTLVIAILFAIVSFIAFLVV
jgi:protein translocase SecG subunit